MVESRFGALKELRRAAIEPNTQPVESERPQTNAGDAYEPVKRGQGRPGGGKRSNPEYERLTILIRKTTRRKVDMRMLQEPELAADLSELVDRLLDKWVQ